MTGDSCSATSSPAADIAYTVPSAPTATSRAARPGTSAIEICQLKPIGANTCCSAWPSMPAKLYWIAGPVAPSRRRREARQEPQQHHQREDDGADAAQEDARALPQAEREVAQVRPAVGRQLQHQRLVAALASTMRFSTQATAIADDDAGDVQHEQHQALQVERRRPLRSG